MAGLYAAREHLSPFTLLEPEARCGMRSILPILLLLAACSQQPAEPSIHTGTYAGQGRDRLCLAGEPGNYRGGLIAYGKGAINCSVSGRVEAEGERSVLVPRGEGDCRIPLEIQGNVVRVGQPPAACSYYCGPGAGMAGRAYHRANMGAKAIDLAGDPLC
jgi:hypothetical protein